MKKMKKLLRLYKVRKILNDDLVAQDGARAKVWKEALAKIDSKIIDFVVNDI